mmetsp:Transcript_14489/g.42228  ORF Transcript_14489/g.42228 Transcript_14489/m.42228 type:complete len:456 (+) Transcript_14489:733-2100(+)|eukprot:366104-Chlamydomonas_euryale.AAC.2
MIPVVGAVAAAVADSWRRRQRRVAAGGVLPHKLAVGLPLVRHRDDDLVAVCGVGPPQPHGARWRARCGDVDKRAGGDERVEVGHSLLACVCKAPSVVHLRRHEVDRARHVEKDRAKVAVFSVGVARFQHKVLGVAKDAGSRQRVGLERQLHRRHRDVGHVGLAAVGLPCVGEEARPRGHRRALVEGKHTLCASVARRGRRHSAGAEHAAVHVAEQRVLGAAAVERDERAVGARKRGLAAVGLVAPLGVCVVHQEQPRLGDRHERRVPKVVRVEGVRCLVVVGDGIRAGAARTSLEVGKRDAARASNAEDGRVAFEAVPWVAVGTGCERKSKRRRDEAARWPEWRRLVVAGLGDLLRAAGVADKDVATVLLAAGASRTQAADIGAGRAGNHAASQVDAGGLVHAAALEHEHAAVLAVEHVDVGQLNARLDAAGADHAKVPRHVDRCVVQPGAAGRR